jgi:hypothetical protein
VRTTTFYLLLSSLSIVVGADARKSGKPIIALGDAPATVHVKPPIAVSDAPVSLRDLAKQWPKAKQKYVAGRIASAPFVLALESAQDATGVALSKEARAGLAIEYAGAEWELQRTGLASKSWAANQGLSFKRYFQAAFSESSSSQAGEDEFVFETSQPGLTVLAKTSGGYGKLKVKLNPEVDVFTVTVDEDVYDSEDTLILYSDTYAVVVERLGEQCDGSVTIRANRTTEFACR